MTGFANAIASITARFDANYANYPVQKANEQFTTPEPPSPWVWLEIVGGSCHIASIASTGNHLFRHSGVIMAHVFVQSGTGDTLVNSEAATIGQIFSSASFDGVQCFAPSIGPGETADEAGLWYRVSVSIPFDFDYIG